MSGFLKLLKVGVVMLAALTALAVTITGCLGGGETTVTSEKTVTVTVATTQTGSSQADKDSYTKVIKDLTGRADQINTDFRELIDKFNAGLAKAEDMTAKADGDRIAYEEMSAQLTTMKVPHEFQDAHKLLISGFNKWQSAYEAYRDGFRDNNNDVLNKARDFDNQAVIEVNQAISQISQVQ